MKKLIRKELLLLPLAASILTIFASCKENYSLINKDLSTEQIQAKIVLPEYKKYPELNKAISDFIDEDFSQYKSQCESFWESGSHYPYSYRTEFQDKSNSYYINAFVTKFIFAGISLEDEYFFTFVYNKKTKKLETLESVTGKSLSEIGKICAKDIKIQVFNETGEKTIPFVDDWIETGTAPREMNYASWTADKDKVTIYFPTGQVLSNYFGSRKVEIPLKN